MIENIQIFGASDHIDIKWDSPKYDPVIYKFQYSCGPKSGGPNYITSPVFPLSSYQTGVRLPHLRPSSVCQVRLVAIYNPASLDPGLLLDATTFDKGNYFYFANATFFFLFHVVSSLQCWMKSYKTKAEFGNL